MSEYPEHDKLAKVKDKSQTCGQFLDWLESDGRILCKYHKHTDDCGVDRWGHPDCGYSEESLVPIHTSIEDLLAEFFQIDRKKLEQEKRQMLNEIRRANDSNKPSPAKGEIS